MEKRYRTNHMQDESHEEQNEIYKDGNEVHYEELDYEQDSEELDFEMHLVEPDENGGRQNEEDEKDSEEVDFEIQSVEVEKEGAGKDSVDNVEKKKRKGAMQSKRDYRKSLRELAKETMVIERGESEK